MVSIDWGFLLLRMDGIDWGFYFSVIVFILFFFSFLVSRQMVWDEMVFGGVFWWLWAISGLHSWVYQKERWESNSPTHWEVSLCSTSI